jgi:hypothetical protein
MKGWSDMESKIKIFKDIEREFNIKGFSKIAKAIIRQDGKAFVNPDLKNKKTIDKINIDNIIIEFC